MAQTIDIKPVRIQPDLEFIKELQEVGGDSLKKCYQCATCSVACPISPNTQPYPRKEMVWAQWGLKDKLMSDPDIWLCHNCGTCSDLCPRGARPSDLISAMRNMVYKTLSEPSIIGKWMTSVKYLPVLVLIPAVLFLIIWKIMSVKFNGGLMIPSGEIVFGKVFYGDYTIDPVFGLVVLFVLFTFWKGSVKLIKSFEPEGGIMVLGKNKHWIWHLVDVIKDEIVTHKKFQDCGDDKADRKIGHMSLFYGFVALFIVTSVVALGHWGGKVIPAIALHTPMNLLNPVKILANVGMIAMLVGLTMLTRRRLNQDAKKTQSSWYDWYLLYVIWAVGLTGMFSQIFRLANVPNLAYPVYYLHLVSVFMLFAYLPWSKLGHLVYRTVALTYVRYMGRK